MEHEVTVYGLIDPRDGTIRYVGQTAYTLVERLRHHVAGINADATRKGMWLRELRELGVRPQIKGLEVTDSERANECELRHILALRGAGYPLTNDEQPRTVVRRLTSKARWTMRATRLPPEVDAQLRHVASAMDLPVAHVMYLLLTEALAARAQVAATRQANIEEEERA